MVPSQNLQRWAGVFFSSPLGFLFGLTLLASCQSSKSTSSPAPVSNPLVEKGRTTYQTTCIACHNSDPRRPGALGPEVSGASKELLEARILRAEYPPGYTPKRNTRTMVALPQLKDEIEAIHAFLNSQ